MNGFIGSGCGSFRLVRCWVGRTVIAGVVSYMPLCWGEGGCVFE